MEAKAVTNDGGMTVEFTPAEVEKIREDLLRAANISDETTLLWRFLNNAPRR